MSKNQKHKKDLAVAKSQVAAELCKEEAARGGRAKRGAAKKQMLLFLSTHKDREMERERERARTLWRIRNASSSSVNESSPQK